MCIDIDVIVIVIEIIGESRRIGLKYTIYSGFTITERNKMISVIPYLLENEEHLAK